MLWDAPVKSLRYVAALAVNPRETQVIYAAPRGNGVMKTVDGGQSWRITSKGLTASEVLALAIDPRDTQVVFAGTRGGEVFSSRNGGLRWNASGLGVYDVFAFAIDAQNPATVYSYGCGRLQDYG